MLVIAALLVAGCGSAQRAAASDTAARFLTAVGEDDLGTACGLLAPDVECDPVAELTGGAVGETAVWGDRAQVRSVAGTLFLVELDAGWRVSAAGCSPSVEGTYECVVAGS